MNGVKTTFYYKGEEGTRVELFTDNFGGCVGHIIDAVIFGEKPVKQIVITLDAPMPKHDS